MGHSTRARAASKGKWVIRLDPDLLVAAGRLHDRHFKMLVFLEMYARCKSSCWPSNETLADATGHSVRTVERTLKEMEALGLISRDVSTCKGTKRSGIRLGARLVETRSNKSDAEPPMEERPTNLTGGRPTELTGRIKTHSELGGDPPSPVMPSRETGSKAPRRKRVRMALARFPLKGQFGQGADDYADAEREAACEPDPATIPMPVTARRPGRYGLTADELEEAMRAESDEMLAYL